MVQISKMPDRQYWFPGVNGESLLLLLAPLCVAQGSACNSKNSEPSHVLRELGLNDHEIQSSIRFSFTRDTTRDDVDFALEKYISAVNQSEKIIQAISMNDFYKKKHDIYSSYLIELFARLDYSDVEDSITTNHYEAFMAILTIILLFR